MMGTMTLTDFLLARINEDERVANAVPEVEAKSDAQIFTSLHEPTGTVEVSAARVLAECEAKREAVEAAWDDHVRIEGEWGRGRSRQELEAANDAPPVVQCLALPYADHPDYREEWRP